MLSFPQYCETFVPPFISPFASTLAECDQYVSVYSYAHAQRRVGVELQLWAELDAALSRVLLVKSNSRLSAMRLSKCWTRRAQLRGKRQSAWPSEAAQTTKQSARYWCKFAQIVEVHNFEQTHRVRPLQQELTWSAQRSLEQTITLHRCAQERQQVAGPHQRRPHEEVHRHFLQRERSCNRARLLLDGHQRQKRQDKLCI